MEDVRVTPSLRMRMNVLISDVLVAVVLVVGAVMMALAWPGERPLDLGGGLLLLGAYVVLVLRRRWPGAVLVAQIVVLLPYNLLE